MRGDKQNSGCDIITPPVLIWMCKYLTLTENMLRCYEEEFLLRIFRLVESKIT
jgi:hypothetical protein